MYGAVLTNVPDMDTLEQRVLDARFDTLAVVGGWGVDKGGWSASNRSRLLSMVPNILVRTTEGDPKSGHPYPHHENILNELSLWRNKPRSYWIIGNEPNVYFDWTPTPTKTQIRDYAYGYRYHLALTRGKLRDLAVAPIRPKLVAPAMSLDPRYMFLAEEMLSILAEEMRRFDVIGWHIYSDVEENLKESKQQRAALTLANKYFPNHPHLITECGMNDPLIPRYERTKQTGEFLRASPWGGVMYHICDKGDIDPQYHISPVDAQTCGTDLEAIW